MSKKVRSWIGRSLGLALGVGMLCFLIGHVGFRKFFDTLANASPLWLAAASLIYALSWVFRTLRLQCLILPSGAKIGPWKAFRIHIAGYALNSILPVKMGDVTTMVYLKCDGINIGRAAAIVVQTRLLDLAGLVILFVPTFALVLDRGLPRWVLPSYLVCIAVACVPIAVVMIDRSHRVSGFLRRVEGYFGQGFIALFVSKAKDAYIGYHEMVANKKLLLATLCLSIVIWLMDVLTCWAVAMAVGGKVSILVVILAVAIGNIGKGAPATPGGMGVYEGLVATAMAFFGFPFDLAVVVAILDHLIKKGFNLIVGLPMVTSVGVTIPQLRAQDPKLKKSDAA